MTFQSKYPNYKIVLKPSHYRFDNLGNRVFVAGLSCQFTDGFYTTEDEETIKLLKSAKSYGIDFWVVGEEKEVSNEGKKMMSELEEAKSETLTDCPYCGNTFKNKAGLMAHIKLKHK